MFYYYSINYNNYGFSQDMYAKCLISIHFDRGFLLHGRPYYKAI